LLFAHLLFAIFHSPRAHLPSTHTHTRRPPSRRLRRALVLSLLACFATITALIALAYWGSRQPPSTWRDTTTQATTPTRTRTPTPTPTPTTDPSQNQSPPPSADTLGRAVEDGLLSIITQPRPAGERWTMALDETSANAWLASRLPAWLASQPGISGLPPSVTGVQVAFLDGIIRITVAVGPAAPGAGLNQPPPPTRYLSSDFAATIAAASTPAPDTTPANPATAPALYLELVGISIGRTPLPTGLVLSALNPASTAKVTPSTSTRAVNALAGDTLTDQGALGAGIAASSAAQRLLNALIHHTPALAPPDLKLPDGRRITIESITASRATLTITCSARSKN